MSLATYMLLIEGLDFAETPLEFIGDTHSNVFEKIRASHNLSEHLEKPRYAKLASLFADADHALLERPLGQALAFMKASGDRRYQSFLNAYGDGVYCRFKLADRAVRDLKGLYAYTVGDALVYVGRCRDSFGKRINSGYGVIAAKNCFRDGQATNCHLNALVAASYPERPKFWIHPMEDNTAIMHEESRILQSLRDRSLLPGWNIACP